MKESGLGQGMHRRASVGGCLRSPLLDKTKWWWMASQDDRRTRSCMCPVHSLLSTSDFSTSFLHICPKVSADGVASR
jgi:hypothetical protein